MTIPADNTRSISAYLDELASSAPAPGGGSVVGLVGALSAALGQMVLNLTLGHGADDAASHALITELRQQQQEMYAAGLADEVAYASYRQAAALPRGSATEKGARRQAMQAALREATEIPMQIARTAARTAALFRQVAAVGNPHLRSDTAIGALLAEAALRGALLNVRGNADLLRDAELAASYRAEAERLEVTGRADAQRAYQAATGDLATAESGPNL